MPLIINSLTYTHPDKVPLFDHLSLSLAYGEKVALVGNNGSGKSTLLQIIAGKLSPSQGQLHLPEKCWYIPQHLGQFDGISIARALEVNKKLHSIKAILQGDTDPRHFIHLDDDWTIEEKVNNALQHWGIGYLPPNRLLGELSGGEKTKVFLAGIDLHQPDILLMDEPTNHLDTAGRGQLYDLVTESKAAILVVSHDRTLLNLLPVTWELSRKGIDVYGGNFDFYHEQKEGKITALQAQLDEQTKTFRQTQQKAREMATQRQKKETKGKAWGQSNSLPRIIAGGLKSKSEVSTAKMMDVHHEKLAGITKNITEINARIKEQQVLKIDIGASGLHQGKILIDAKEMSFSYDQAPLWQPLTFQVRSGDRICIEGNNGAGKTTLLRILTGALEPTEGLIQRAQFSHLYLDQDYTMIQPDLTLYGQVQHYNSRGLQEHELKSLLVHAQFQQEVFDRKCRGLSGGEKMKLSLCCLAVSDHTPDMLILDEPTNNLDVQSMEVLTAAIKDFNGTLLIISHDRFFIDEIAINNFLSITTCHPKTQEPNNV